MLTAKEINRDRIVEDEEMPDLLERIFPPKITRRDALTLPKLSVQPWQHGAVVSGRSARSLPAARAPGWGWIHIDAGPFPGGWCKGECHPSRR